MTDNIAEPDDTAKLWPNTTEAFFREEKVEHLKQKGKTCVPTCLAMLTGESPAKLRERINTQDPVSWSDALRDYKKQLAYLPTDVRKLKFYIDELVKYDDLFLLGFYSADKGDGPEQILKDPNPETHRLCGSHLVVLHRNQILDPNRDKPEDATKYGRLECHTKRLFRVVPRDDPRRL